MLRAGTRARAPESDRPSATRHAAPHRLCASQSTHRPRAIASPIASSVQAGAFSERDRPNALRASHRSPLHADARGLLHAAPDSPWRVIVGREMTRDQATELAVARTASETGAALVSSRTRDLRPHCWRRSRSWLRNSTHPPNVGYSLPQKTYPNLSMGVLRKVAIPS